MSVPKATSAPMPISAILGKNNDAASEELDVKDFVIMLGKAAVRLGENPSDEKIAEFHHLQTRVIDAHHLHIKTLMNRMVLSEKKFNTENEKLVEDLQMAREISSYFQRLHLDSENERRIQVEEIHHLRNPAKDLEHKKNWANKLKMTDFTAPEITFNKNDPWSPPQFLLGIRKMFRLLVGDKATYDDNTILQRLFESVNAAQLHEINVRLKEQKDEFKEQIEKAEHQRDAMLAEMTRAQNQSVFFRSEKERETCEMKEQMVSLCTQMKEVVEKKTMVEEKVKEQNETIKRLEAEKKEADVKMAEMQKKHEKAMREKEKSIAELRAKLAKNHEKND